MEANFKEWLDENEFYERKCKRCQTLKVCSLSLNLTCERRVEKLIVEIDSKIVIKWLDDEGYENHPYVDDVVDRKSLVRMPWTCCVRHIPREANEVADALAKMGHHLKGHSDFSEGPPLNVVELLK